MSPGSPTLLTDKGRVSWNGQDVTGAPHKLWDLSGPVPQGFTQWPLSGRRRRAARRAWSGTANA